MQNINDSNVKSILFYGGIFIVVISSLFILLYFITSPTL